MVGDEGREWQINGGEGSNLWGPHAIVYDVESDLRSEFVGRGPIGAPPISVDVFFNWESWPMWLSVIGHIAFGYKIGHYFLPSDNFSHHQITKAN